MRSFLLTATALTALTVPAAAADLAMSYPVKAPPLARFSWTGAYIGANAGMGAGVVDYSETTSVAPGNTTTYYDFQNLTTSTYAAGTVLGYNTASDTASGAIAGGQVGYNYQLDNNVVLGAEADIQWSGISGTAKENFSNTLVDSANVAYIFGSTSTQVLSYGQAGVTERSAGLDYYGTVRARLGYAMGRFLPYLTGGVAYGRTTVEGSTTSQTFVNTLDYTTGAITNSTVRGTVALPSTSEDKWGWTVGGGGEFAIADDWTVKAEYLYMDLGSMDYAYLNSFDSTLHMGSVDTKFHTLRAGVNYKF